MISPARDRGIVETTEGRRARIPGTTKHARLLENSAATDLTLDARDLREIDESVSRITPSGDRYAPTTTSDRSLNAGEARPSND